MASELRDAIARALSTQTTCDGEPYPSELHYRQSDAVLAVLDANPDLVGDEHHTMAELYEYRMLYNAHAVKAWLFSGYEVVKSWRHADGEECFGGGWFIVTVQLPTGQVSNHYKAEHWGLFVCPEVELAPTWDGHTPAVAAERLRAALGGERDA